MKIVRYLDVDGRTRFGETSGPNLAHRIEGDIFGRHEVTHTEDEVVKRLAPVDPPNVFCIGLNYKAHAEESGAKFPEAPVIFIKATTTVTAPGAPIILPKSAPLEVDYEAELAIVIGRQAHRVSEADALNYVFGYTCADDVSARDCQTRIDVQWARGKSFDTFCPLGPHLVTADEVDGDHLGIRSVLNGNVMQDSNTSDMIFSCRHLVSYLSHQFTLLPGTVICTGTPEGVGFARKPPVFLRPGDEITIAIDQIGQLTNPVLAED
jgi:2-keto-4-pentenoate hydratase/2-oxohepta-3-ene-1,7-dioic acid hydratase in catechol pathway